MLNKISLKKLKNCYYTTGKQKRLLKIFNTKHLTTTSNSVLYGYGWYFSKIKNFQSYFLIFQLYKNNKLFYKMQD